eukprot:GSMAST32.ASY1.ANO1.2317.1 assembled CDS
MLGTEFDIKKTKKSTIIEDTENVFLKRSEFCHSPSPNACPTMKSKVPKRKLNSFVFQYSDTIDDIAFQKLSRRAADRIYKYFTKYIKYKNDTITRDSKWRSPDGFGNNMKHLHWGSAGDSLRRLFPAAYSDKYDSPAGRDRPSARKISNSLSSMIMNDTKTNKHIDLLWSPRHLNDMMVHFGQFLAHDISLTTPQPNSSPSENFAIKVPKGDKTFDKEGKGNRVIRFRRSIYHYKNLTNNSYNGREHPIREQTNKVSSFLDGSTIYGSNRIRQKSLRLGKFGLLANRRHTNAKSISRCPYSLMLNQNRLPNDNPTAKPTEKLSLAGDTRANIQPGLLALHTLWHREHNRWASAIRHELKRYNNSITMDSIVLDELLFKESRRFVESELQHITYNEYLPALLGHNALGVNGTFPYMGYNSSIDPGVLTEFSTAAFRLPHSQINDVLLLCGVSTLHLSNSFFLDIDEYSDIGTQKRIIDAILHGMTILPAQALDVRTVSAIRNTLLGLPSQGGLDLTSLDIQRGRDHGLQDFLHMSKYYNKHSVSVNQIQDSIENNKHSVSVNQIQDSIENKLRSLYHIENTTQLSNIDAIVDSIIVEQFRRIRDGDRFWYQNIVDFTEEDINDIMTVATLNSVVRRNTRNNTELNQSRISSTSAFFTDVLIQPASKIALHNILLNIKDIED